ncbi:acyl carrier protein [Zygosaccharomyces mellis]|uniref:Acyl carrier protein n=1 Tax=Zygosaccharomyces mellis TaxID=42258 RepID=A0A4C2E8I5_9SACH|nr:acyl carrier protein [Zygosaccharomyces mellis]
MFKSVFRPCASAARNARLTLPVRSNVFTPQMMVSPIRFYSATTDRNEITQKVVDVIKAFDRTNASADINAKTLFHKDLGLDSLDTVELLVAIEEDFDIQFPDKVADELKGVEDTVEWIATHPESE